MCLNGSKCSNKYYSESGLIACCTKQSNLREETIGDRGHHVGVQCHSTVSVHRYNVYTLGLLSYSLSQIHALTVPSNQMYLIKSCAAKIKNNSWYFDKAL